MKYFTLFLLLLLFVQLTNAQPNLVPNSSFENKKKCLKTSEDNNIDSLNNVEKWFSLLPYWNNYNWGGQWGGSRCFGVGCIWGGVWTGGVRGGGGSVGRGLL